MDSKANGSDSSRPATAAGLVETIEISADVFQKTCLALMDEVQGGSREYVITRDGRPVARLVRPDVDAPSAFGILRGTLLEQDDLVGPDFEAWGEGAE